MITGERGVLLAVATSTLRASALQRLGKHGLAEHFDAIVTGDEVRHGKPAPDIFLLAAERVGADPSRCVVVEGSLTGVSAGRASGMTVYAVALTFSVCRLDPASLGAPALHRALVRAEAIPWASRRFR